MVVVVVVEVVVDVTDVEVAVADVVVVVVFVIVIDVSVAVTDVRVNVVLVELVAVVVSIMAAYVSPSTSMVNPESKTWFRMRAAASADTAVIITATLPHAADGVSCHNPIAILESISSVVATANSLKLAESPPAQSAS